MNCLIILSSLVQLTKDNGESESQGICMDVSSVGFIYVIILRIERSILLLFQVDNLMNNFGGGCQAILNHRRQPMGYVAR